MSETEGGAALAWRLLATLEGGSLILASSALIAYTARARVTTQPPLEQTMKQVLITNIKNDLGRELKKQLEQYGFVVSTMTQEEMGRVTSYGTGSTEAEVKTVDALVVIGADPKADGLDNLADLVTRDIYENVKLLESLSSLVRRGGSLCWACAGSSVGVFRAAATAFDDVLRANLQHVATNVHCKAVWVGRCPEAERVAERVAAALSPCDPTLQPSSSFRYAAQKVIQYFGRWLKIMA